MPGSYELTDFRSRRVLRIELQGPMNSENVVALVEAHPEVPGLIDSHPALWDLRQGDASAFALAEMEKIRAYMGSRMKPTGPKVAFLVRAESETRLFRLWSDLIQQASDRERRIFLDEAASLDWLVS